MGDLCFRHSASSSRYGPNNTSYYIPYFIMEEEHRNAKAAIKEAITQHPLSFTYLNEDARNDEEIAKHALKHMETNFFESFCRERKLPNGEWDGQQTDAYDRIYSLLISNVGPVLKNDKSFTLWVLTELYRTFYIDQVFDSMSNHLKDDEDVILAAVAHLPEYFDYASDRLKDDKEFLKKLLLDSPWSTEYISDRLRDDEEFLRLALGDSESPIDALHQKD